MTASSETHAPYWFDIDHLARLADRYRELFPKAEPFPHVVMESLVPDDVLEEVLEEFPPPDAEIWRRRKKETSRKFTTSDSSLLGPATRQLLAELNGSMFCMFLEEVSGIRGILPDPHLEGGGLHQSTTGGFLKIHADFNLHPTLRVHRRLNLLVYLNHEWRDEWGGHLELWDQGMTSCQRRIAPVFGRSVLFATTDTSYHGHPEPMKCPSGVTRKSLALYYYTAEPAGDSPPARTTLYKERPGERFGSQSARAPVRDRVARTVRRVLQ